VEPTARRVRPLDWELPRDPRRLALGSDPSSFACTYGKEAAFAEERWRERPKADARGGETATLLLFLAAVPAGLVAAYRDEWPEVFTFCPECAEREFEPGESKTA
jgi:hypothetical protein